MIAKTRVGVGTVEAAARVGGSGVLIVTVTRGQLCLHQLTGVRDTQSWALVTVVRTDFNQWYGQILISGIPL